MKKQDWINVAKIIIQNKDWKVVRPENKWRGIDIECDTHILQYDLDRREFQLFVKKELFFEQIPTRVLKAVWAYIDNV